MERRDVREIRRGRQVHEGEMRFERRGKWEGKGEDMMGWNK